MNMGTHKKFISSGSFCKVYRGKAANNKHTIVKKYDSLSKEYFREIYSISRIPQIIYIIEANPSNYTINMPYKGIDMFESIQYNKENVVPRLKFLPIILYQCLDSLAYIHSQKIIHKDIKPENILLDRYNNVTIIDYGSSRVSYGQIETFDSTVGTVVYGSPELHSGKSYSFNTDIWSLAVTVYSYITTSLLFDDKCNMKEELSKVNTHSVISVMKIKVGEQLKGKRIDLLTSSFDDLFNKMLVYDSTQRYNSWDLINHPYFTAETKKYSKPKRSNCRYSFVDFSNIKKCNENQKTYIRSLVTKVKESLRLSSAVMVNAIAIFDYKLSSSWSEEEAHNTFIGAMFIAEKLYSKNRSFSFAVYNDMLMGDKKIKDVLTSILFKMEYKLPVFVPGYMYKIILDQF